MLVQSISMIENLFLDAWTTMNINGQPTTNSSIKKVVSEICLVALYICLVIGKAINQHIKPIVHAWKVRSICISNDKNQQIISQYIDDIYFTIHGDH